MPNCWVGILSINRIDPLVRYHLMFGRWFFPVRIVNFQWSNVWLQGWKTPLKNGRRNCSPIAFRGCCSWNGWVGRGVCDYDTTIFELKLYKQPSSHGKNLYGTGIDLDMFPYLRHTWMYIIGITSSFPCLWWHLNRHTQSFKTAVRLAAESSAMGTNPLTCDIGPQPRSPQVVKSKGIPPKCPNNSGLGNYSLKLTASLHLKIAGWKLEDDSFPSGVLSFQVRTVSCKL